ncbi:MAG: hypothetical protein IJ733_19860 [Lachnospiraceae bacterium]|nr:hypothetical protein [Lachnospiraceae bacterium]
MNPQELLRRMNEEDIQTAFGGMFYGKVCEYLSHETRSSVPLMHISEWLDEETRYEAEMEFYFDQYHMKNYCGAEGKYGFHVEIDRVSVSAYENEDLYD